VIEIPRNKKQQPPSESSNEEDIPSNIIKEEDEKETEQLLDDVVNEEDEEDYDAIDEQIDEEEEEKPVKTIITPEKTLPDQHPIEEEEEHLTEDELESIVDDNGSGINTEELEIEAIKPELPINEEVDTAIVPEKEEVSTIQEIDEELQLEKRMNSISYLVEYTKGTWRMPNEVADKVGINGKTGSIYLKEYINLVRDGFADNSYPNNVLRYYNHGVTDENKKLKYHHMDKLKELVKRYSKYDVNAYLKSQNKTLNSDGNDKFISNKRVAFDENNNNLSLLGPGGQQQDLSAPPPPNNTGFSNDIDHLQDGITALQLIRFGLVQVFGQTPKMKIGLLLGENPTPYLMDEQKMKKLLVMSGATESRAEYFIDWLKTNAHYVAHPQGFLAYGGSSGPSSTPSQYGISPQYSTGYSNGHTNRTSDPMTDFYYQTGVYMQGFPPEHPINREALKEYREQKREDEQMKAVDKRLNMSIRVKMMESMEGMGTNKQGNSLFSPEMMLMLGIGQYRQTGTDPDGKPVFGIVPNFGAFGSGQQQAGPITSPTDQMTSMMAMMKEMMGFMASMNKGDPAQQNFMTTIMGGFAQKILEPQQNKMQEVMETAKLLQELKGPQLPASNMGAIMDPEVIIKTKRMELDKEFGMRRLDLQQQELNLQKERLAMQDKEANANLEKIMEGVTSFAPTLLGMAQQFIMGNRGQPAQPGPQGGQQPGQPQTNPAEMLLKMEYQKQQQQAALEAERKRREWEEELKRKNAEYEAQRAWQQPQQPQPETEKVIIKEPVIHQPPSQRKPEQYNEETFLPFSPDELEDALVKAGEQKKKLEEYMATVGSVLQNKILNGEGQLQQEETTTIITPSHREITPVVEEEEEEQEQQDFTQMLDSYPSNQIDPDYSGPSEEGEKEHKSTTLDEEQVDIN
jgi:hypothetical protein